MANIKVGIIGGTGMQDWDVFELKEEKDVVTPYGKPSSKLTLGTVDGLECVLLNRHGSGHRSSPTYINYRANVYALHQEGCTHILATSACGSLKKECVPGHFVIIDQFIDRTNKRHTTFYDGEPGSLEGVCHIPMRHPFCAKLREVIVKSCIEEKVHVHSKGTAITIEGPRFSSYAESHMYRSWGGSIINMTTIPEVCLAHELGMLYAVIAMVTDYDCWQEDHEAVHVDYVMKVMKENREKVTRVVAKTLKAIGDNDWAAEVENAKMIAKTSVML
uniref:S-methyl-5'-thioadenosine phosphorylase n=1 Tax=Phallusia mammillata TaxID=59560 RepID=A0A6F9DM24_9ASCI|nr:S-methyl-5'-thioadenosine phosphorylase [Phallusia mammillata]